MQLLHACFDLSVTREVFLRDLIDRPATRVDSFQAFLDEVDVTKHAKLEKDRLQYLPDDATPDGEHELRVVVWDRAGNHRTVNRFFRTDATPPLLVIQSPLDGAHYRDEAIKFAVRYNDPVSGVDRETVRLKINGQDRSAELVLDPGGAQCQVPALDESEHIFVFECADHAGNQARVETKITIDRTAPLVTLEFPEDGAVIGDAITQVRGRIQEENLEAAWIGEKELSIQPDGSFVQTIALEFGLNNLQVVARDVAGNEHSSPLVRVQRADSRLAGYAGVVLDAYDVPLSNVRVSESKSGAIAFTDARGRFFFDDLPDGQVLVDFTPPDVELNAPLTIPIRLAYGRITRRENAIKLLPAANPDRMQSQATPEKIALTNPDAPGLELRHDPETEFEFPAGARAEIFIDLVDSESLPVDLPDFIPPGKIARLEPSGLKVKNDATIELILPNSMGADAGDTIPLITYDEARGRWYTGAMARVSEDGETIETLPAMGLRHFSLAAAAPIGAHFDLLDESANDPGIGTHHGGLRTTLSLPGFRDHGANHNPTLVYDSLTAAPRARVSAVFRGLREIHEVRPVTDRLAVDVEQSGQRILPRYTYEVYQRYQRVYDSAYPNYSYSYRPINEFLYDERVELPPIYVPEGGDNFALPAPETIYFRELESRPISDWTLVQSANFYEIKIRNKVERHSGLWPESITARCWFSDQDSGEFTIEGPLEKIGPEPKPGEEDARESFPRLQPDTQIVYSMTPRGPAGAYYPTGLYNFFAKYRVNGRDYNMTRAAVIAEEFSVDTGWIKSIYENLAAKAGITPFYNNPGHHSYNSATLVGHIRPLLYALGESERQDMAGLLDVIEKGHELYWSGPDYESRIDYGDPLNLLLKSQGGTAIVHNLVNSPFGRGWRLREVQSIHPVGRGRVLLVDESGPRVFTTADRIERIAAGLYGPLARKQSGGALMAAVTLPAGDWIPDIDRITSHADAVGNTILTILKSPAFANAHPTDQDFVERMFLALIGREATADEESYWVDQKSSSHIHKFIGDFLESDEFRQAFAGEMIRLLLDREALPEERLQLAQLPRFARTYFDANSIVTSILTGAEFSDALAADVDFVDAVFAKLTTNWNEVSESDRSSTTTGYANILKSKSRTDFLNRYVLRQRMTKHRFARDYLQRLLNAEPYRANGIHLLRNGRVEMQPATIKNVNATRTTRRLRQNRFSSQHSFDASPRGQLLNSSSETLEDVLASPAGLAIGPEGEVYVSDAATHRIYKIQPASPAWDAIGSFTDAQQILGHVSGGLSRTNSVYQYFDANGNLVKTSATDINAGQETHIIYREYTETTEPVGKFVQSGYTPDGTYAHANPVGVQITDPVRLHTPGGLAVDSTGALLFAETGTHRVRRFDQETRELTTVVGTGQTEYRPGQHDRAPVNLRAPLNLALTLQGDLYILFHPVGEQQAIGRYDRNGRFSHIAGSPYENVGTIDTGVDAKFYKLLGAASIDVNERGEVFILMKDQHRVLVVTREAKIDAVAGDGRAAELTGDGGPALQASLSNPSGMTLDANGNVLISDSGHRSLRLVSQDANEGYTRTEFLGPRGHYASRLIRQRDGSYERMYKDGRRALFSDQGRQLALVDRNGNRTEYHYELDRLTRVEYPGGSSLDFEYENEKLKSIADHNDRQTSFHVADGLLDSAIQADGSELKFEYDEEGRLTAARAPGEVERIFQYDPEGRLISGNSGASIEPPIDGARIARENERRLTVGAESTAATITGPDRSSYTLKVEQGRLTEYRRGAVGMRIHYNVGLLPILIERSTGSFIQFEYNERGDLIRLFDSFLNAEKTTEINGSGLPGRETDFAGTIRDFFYDERGNLIRSEKMGRLLLEQVWNERGLLATRRASGLESEYTYDLRGNLERASTGDAVLKLERDPGGNARREFQGGNPPRHYEYDLWNRLLKVTEARGVTEYEYDALGRLAVLRSPGGREHSYDYDASGNMVALNLPGDRTWRFEYDGQKRLTRKESPGGGATHFRHREDGFQEETTEDEFIEKDFYIDGALRWARNGSVELRRIFDEAGRLTVEEFYLLPGIPIDVERELDADGRLELLRVPGGEILYDYDEFGWLQAVRSGDFALSIERDPSARPNIIHSGEFLTTQIAYETSGSVNRITTLGAQTQLADSAANFDAANNITRLRQDDHSTDYEYDPDEQLIREGAVDSELIYNYNSDGDRIHGQAGEYFYDVDGSLREGAGFQYTYDGEGRVSTRTELATGHSAHFRYNHLGQLIQFRLDDGLGNEQDGVPLLRATYSYDALGRRVFKRVVHRDLTRETCIRYFVYFREEVLLELDERSQIIRMYIPGPQIDGHLGFIENDRAYYFGRDCLGNITHVIDESGKIVCRYRYDAFGVPLEEEEEIENSFRYRGREWDRESATYYYRHRTYDPALGRFLQPDPAPGQQNRPLSMFNRYAYAWNNPLRYSDPLGLHPGQQQSVQPPPRRNRSVPTGIPRDDDPIWNQTSDGNPTEDVPSSGSASTASWWDLWDFSWESGDSINNAPRGTQSNFSAAREYAWGLEVQRIMRDNERSLWSGFQSAINDRLQANFAGLDTTSGLAIPAGGPLLDPAALVDQFGVESIASSGPPAVFLPGPGSGLSQGAPEVASSPGLPRLVSLRSASGNLEDEGVRNKRFLDERFEELEGLVEAAAEDPARWPEVLEQINRIHFMLLYGKKVKGYQPENEDLADDLERAFLAYAQGDARLIQKNKQYKDLSLTLLGEAGITTFLKPEAAKSIADKIAQMDLEYRLMPRRIFDVWFILKKGAEFDENGRRTADTAGWTPPDGNVVYLREPDDSSIEFFDDPNAGNVKAARQLLAIYIHETVHAVTKGNGLLEGGFGLRQLMNQAYTGKHYADFRAGLHALEEALVTRFTHELLLSTRYGTPKMEVHAYTDMKKTLDEFIQNNNFSWEQLAILYEVFLNGKNIIEVAEQFFEDAGFSDEEMETQLSKWGREFRGKYINTEDGQARIVRGLPDSEVAGPRPHPILTPDSCKAATESHKTWFQHLINGCETSAAGEPSTNPFTKIYLNGEYKLGPKKDTELLPPVVPAGILSPFLIPFTEGLENLRESPPRVMIDSRLSGIEEKLLIHRASRGLANANAYRCEWSFWYRWEGDRLRLIGIRERAYDQTLDPRRISLIEARKRTGNEMFLRSELQTFNEHTGGGIWTRPNCNTVLEALDENTTAAPFRREYYELDNGNVIGGHSGSTYNLDFDNIYEALMTALVANSIIHRLKKGTFVSKNVYDRLEREMRSLQGRGELPPEDTRFGGPDSGTDYMERLKGITIVEY
ncbi:MAG: DUF4214 domain-containing protein [bacterium]|nr:DUF4214 domain-containing protein [bacterium]